MRYLITTKSGTPFLTNWFDTEMHFKEKEGMIVYDLMLNKYMENGETWNDIELDHL